jgi:hypothetical protein
MINLFPVEKQGNRDEKLGLQIQPFIQLNHRFDITDISRHKQDITCPTLHELSILFIEDRCCRNKPFEMG